MYSCKLHKTSRASNQLCMNYELSFGQHLVYYCDAHDT